MGLIDLLFWVLLSVFVIGLALELLDWALRRHERQVEAQSRRRVLREVARHE